MVGLRTRRRLYRCGALGAGYVRWRALLGKGKPCPYMSVCDGVPLTHFALTAELSLLA
jgi:hypothetical protein